MYTNIQYLQHGKEGQVLPYSQSIKENIVLWTDPQTTSDQVHLSVDVVAIDLCPSGRSGEESSEYGHGGGLSRSIVAQQSGYLTLVHVEGKIVYSNLPSLGILETTDN